MANAVAGNFVLFNHPVDGSVIAQVYADDGAGVVCLLAYRKGGRIEPWQGISGAGTPAAGQYDNDTPVAGGNLGALSVVPDIILPISLILAAHTTGSVAARFTPGFAGRIIGISESVVTPATTAAKLGTFAPSIAGTPVTGGLLALTSANQTPVGAAVAGSAITALNTFTAAQEITIVSSAVTAFIEGEGVIYLTLRRTS